MTHEIAPAHPRFAPWLLQPMLENKAIYLKVALAAAMINLFGLGSSLFSMTVYDRVVPNNATASLIGLSIGLGIVVVFDFVLRSLRSYFVDMAGMDIDRKLGGAAFARLLALRLDLRKGSTGSLAAMMRELETLRDFFASATLTALVDVPFIVLTLVVIAAMGAGWWWCRWRWCRWWCFRGWRPIPRSTGWRRARWARAGQAGGAGGDHRCHRDGQDQRGGWADGAALACGDRSPCGLLVAAEAGGGDRGECRDLGSDDFLCGRHHSWCFDDRGASIDLGRAGGLFAAGRAGSGTAGPDRAIALAADGDTHGLSPTGCDDGHAGGGGEGEPLRPSRIDGGIEFRNVSFRYPGAAEKALSEVSFSIRSGEHVALLGRVGSGKSTVARMAMGLYPPGEGMVRIDGMDLAQIDLALLRGQIGAALQESVLFTGTVRENILLDRALDDDELLRLARVSGAHEFIGRMANGYDLRLGDRGESLSGGQRQAIALTRALAGNPPMLIFDEPTSAMDVGGESALIARLEQELKGRTLMLITHRPSLLKLVDRIILLEGGRIVADGPRDMVLAQIAKAAA
jgi:ATP-binding cassette subfamily C protein LapB